jgi:hypothetical protein
MKINKPWFVSVAPVLLAVLAWPHQAVGDVLYQTGFEPPEFTAGLPVDGQAGWIARSSVNAGIISTVNPHDGLQDLQVIGGRLEIFPLINRYLGVYRPNITFDSNGLPVRIQVDARFDGPRTTSADMIALRFNVFTGNDNQAELAISPDGHIYGNMEQGSLLFAVPTTPGQYYTLALQLDFASRIAQFFVDGQLLGSQPMPAEPSNRFVANLVVNGSPEPGYNPGDYTAYFDNFSITTVPEPSTLLLVATGGLGSVLCGWRRCRGRR